MKIGKEGSTMITIEQLRDKIEQADAIIIATLAKRQALAKLVGQLKSNQGKAVFDPAREEALFELYGNLSEKYHLQQSYVKRLFKLIIAYSRRMQKSN